MIEPKEAPAQELALNSNRRPESSFRLPRGFLIVVCALVLCFTVTLYDWARFAVQSDLYSYILLVPFMSAYLVFLKRNELPSFSPPHRWVALVLATAGLVVLGGFWILTRSEARLERVDSVALRTFAFLLFFAGACVFFLGRSMVRAIAFPLVFLIFMVPFPVVMEQAIESFLQHGSAPPAYWFFKIAGTPVFQHELIFQLPGMTLQIAPECSGIRSSVVLFITSLVAGHLFLRSPWKRAILTAVVLPLALVRNGFRVFTIGELCVHVGPHMIDSPIHHHGGPIFFALSLIPFSLLLYYLIKLERPTKTASAIPAYAKT